MANELGVTADQITRKINILNNLNSAYIGLKNAFIGLEKGTELLPFKETSTSQDSLTLPEWGYDLNERFFCGSLNPLKHEVKNKPSNNGKIVDNQ